MTRPRDPSLYPPQTLVWTETEVDVWRWGTVEYSLVLRRKGWRVKVVYNATRRYPDEPIYLTIQQFRAAWPGAPYLRKQKTWRDDWKPLPIPHSVVEMSPHRWTPRNLPPAQRLDKGLLI